MAVTTDEAVATLLERAAAARAARDAFAAEVRARVVQRMAEQLGSGTEAWLIGSLAWGGFGERSDIDVVLRGATPEQACRLEVGLTRALRLPVDMLRFEELPDSFRKRVVQQGVRLDGK